MIEKDNTESPKKTRLIWPKNVPLSVTRRFKTITADLNKNYDQKFWVLLNDKPFFQNELVTWLSNELDCILYSHDFGQLYKIGDALEIDNLIDSLFKKVIRDFYTQTKRGILYISDFSGFTSASSSEYQLKALLVRRTILYNLFALPVDMLFVYGTDRFNPLKEIYLKNADLTLDLHPELSRISPIGRNRKLLNEAIKNDYWNFPQGFIKQLIRKLKANVSYDLFVETISSLKKEKNALFPSGKALLELLIEKREMNNLKTLAKWLFVQDFTYEEISWLLDRELLDIKKMLNRTIF